MGLPFRKLENFRKSTTGRIHVDGQILGKLKKGGKKPDRGVGRDLKTHFRFAPTDKTQSFKDYESGTEGLTLEDIFIMKYGEKPNNIPCTILGMDHIQGRDIVRFEDYIRTQVSRWAVAQIRNASQMLVIDTDWSGQHVSRVRRSGVLVDVSKNKIPVPIDYNEKDHENYNKSLPEGIECYEYNGKLIPWQYLGRLSLSLMGFQKACGHVGNVVFETSSKIDIDAITGEIFDIIKKTNNSVALSRIPMVLYRAESQISSPMASKNQHISESRGKRVKRANWGVHIKLDPDFVNNVVSRISSPVRSYGEITARRETLDELNESLGLPARAESPPSRIKKIETAMVVDDEVEGEYETAEVGWEDSPYFESIREAHQSVLSHMKNDSPITAIFGDMAGTSRVIAQGWFEKYGYSTDRIKSLVGTDDLPVAVCEVYDFFNKVTKGKMKEDEARDKAKSDVRVALGRGD